MGGIWLGESRSVGRGGGESSRRGRNCGELRSLAWLEQSLLCGAKTGPQKQGAQEWLAHEFKAGREATESRLFFCVALIRRCNIRDGDRTQMFPASLWKKGVSAVTCPLPGISFTDGPQGRHR